eukprot:scaffold11435_cov30-Tisochrysis_lutea.AAC.1
MGEQTLSGAGTDSLYPQFSRRCERRNAGAAAAAVCGRQGSVIPRVAGRERALERRPRIGVESSVAGGL